MTRRDVIAEEILQAAIAALDARIAAPAPPGSKCYSRREAFLRLRAKAKEALAAGHSLETVLYDLKGVGLGLTVSTARQYLKPGRKAGSKKSSARSEQAAKPIKKTIEKAPARPAVKSTPISPVTSAEMKKGTFTVVEDDNDI